MQWLIKTASKSDFCDGGREEGDWRVEVVHEGDAGGTRRDGVGVINDDVAGFKSCALLTKWDPLLW